MREFDGKIEFKRKLNVEINIRKRCLSLKIKFKVQGSKLKSQLIKTLNLKPETWNLEPEICNKFGKLYFYGGKFYIIDAD